MEVYELELFQIYIIILSFYLHGLRQLSAVRLEVHI